MSVVANKGRDVLVQQYTLVLVKSYTGRKVHRFGIGIKLRAKYGFGYKSVLG